MLLTPHLQARGSDLRVHFKNTREAAAAIRGKDLGKAKTYLEDVIAHKRAVPFLRFNGVQGQRRATPEYAWGGRGLLNRLQWRRGRRATAATAGPAALWQHCAA